MKICFTSSLFGKTVFSGDVPLQFEKNPEFDYFLFTDKDQNYYNTSWDVINLSNHPDLTNFQDNILKSRFPKFQGFKLLQSLGLHYDFVFYCDAYFSPNINSNWQSICDSLSLNSLGLIQTKHRDPLIYNGGILKECESILALNKDSPESIENTLHFFQSIDPEVNLSTGPYFENTMFGYDVKNKNIIDFLNNYWTIYSSKKISRRDQLTWNFLLSHYELNPLTHDKFNPLLKFPIIEQCKIENHSEFFFQMTGHKLR